MSETKTNKQVHMFTPPSPPIHFVGREGELALAMDAILSGTSVLVGVEGGRPGVGRSAFAAQLVERLGQVWTGPIIWLSGACADMSVLLARLDIALNMPYRTNPPGNARREVSVLLEKFQPLLILDDMDPGGLAAFPMGAPCIATVRGPAFSTDESWQALTLGLLEDDEARRLIELSLGHGSAQNVSAAMELKDLLSGHALGMAFGLSVVLETGTSDPRGLLSHLRPRLKRLAEFPVERRGVASIFGLLLNQLTQEDRGLIANFGALPNKGFDLDTAASGLGLEFEAAKEAITQAERLNLLEGIGGGRWKVRNLVGDLARGLGDTELASRRIVTHHLSHLRSNDWVKNLLNYEGFKESMDWAKEAKNFPMMVGLGSCLMSLELKLGVTSGLHMLILTLQDAAKFLNMADAQVEAHLGLAKYVSRDGLPVGAEVRSHIQASLAVRASKNWTDQEVKSLLFLGELYLRNGKPGEGLPSLRKAFEVVHSDKALKLTVMTTLGLALNQLGLYEEAQFYLKAAWTGMGPGPDRADVGVAINHCQEQQRISEAFLDPGGDEEEPKEDSLQGQGSDKGLGTSSKRYRVHFGFGESFDPFDETEILGLKTQHTSLLRLAERAGHISAVARHTKALAHLAQAEGDQSKAFDLLLDAVDKWAQTDNSFKQAETMTSLGRVAALSGDLDASIFHRLQALELSEEMEDPAAQAQALLELARVYIERGRPKEAERHLDLCQSLFSDLKDLGGVAASILLRSNATFLSGHPRAAEAWARRALNLAQTLGSGPIEADAELQLGKLFLVRGQLDVALRHIRRGVHLCFEGGDLQGVTQFFLLLGELHQRRGEEGQAFSYFQRVKILSRRLGFLRLEGICLRCIASLAVKLGRLAEGERSYEEALVFQKKVGDVAEETRLLLLLGELYNLRGRGGEALSILESAVAKAEEAGLDELMSRGLQALGVAKSDHDLVTARMHIKESMAIDRRRSDLRGVGAGFAILGQLDLSEGRVEVAKRRFDAGAKELEEVEPERAQFLRTKSLSI